eukprot:2647560-Ditylum_brightwellii.AAC.1
MTTAATPMMINISNNPRQRLHHPRHPHHQAASPQFTPGHRSPSITSTSSSTNGSTAGNGGNPAVAANQPPSNNNAPRTTTSRRGGRSRSPSSHIRRG